MTPHSEIYRREAQKPYALADSFPFGAMRNEFIELARQYDALARHSELTERRTTTDMPEALPGVARLLPISER